jgi:hypothetical protein
MNMTTKIDDIPLKTIKSNDINDDTNDPMVKDILNEFEQELEMNINNNKNDYKVNYEPPVENNRQPIENQNYNIPKKINNNLKKENKINSYINQDYINKTGIIIIIVALLFSPIIFPVIVNKLPTSIISYVENYDFYIKLLLLFIIIYILYFYNFI